MSGKQLYVIAVAVILITSILVLLKPIQCIIYYSKLNFSQGMPSNIEALQSLSNSGPIGYLIAKKRIVTVINGRRSYASFYVTDFPNIWIGRGEDNIESMLGKPDMKLDGKIGYNLYFKDKIIKQIVFDMNHGSCYQTESVLTDDSTE
jgi:hypothetical protein